MEKKAVTMVIDEFLDGDTLVKTITTLRTDPDRLNAMCRQMLQEAKPQALDDIVNELIG